MREVEGLTFREFMPGRWIAEFQGSAVARIEDDERFEPHQVIMIQNAPYTQSPEMNNIIKAIWEKARLLDITKRLMK